MRIDEAAASAKEKMSDRILFPHDTTTIKKERGHSLPKNSRVTLQVTKGNRINKNVFVHKQNIRNKKVNI